MDSGCLEVARLRLRWVRLVERDAISQFAFEFHAIGVLEFCFDGKLFDGERDRQFDSRGTDHDVPYNFGVVVVSSVQKLMFGRQRIPHELAFDHAAVLDSRAKLLIEVGRQIGFLHGNILTRIQLEPGQSGDFGQR